MIMGNRYTYMDDKTLMYDYSQKLLSVIFCDVDGVNQGYFFRGKGDPDRIRGFIIKFEIENKLDDIVKSTIKNFEKKFSDKIVAIFDGIWTQSIK